MTVTFVVTSFEKTEKGNWFVPHKQNHHSHHCKQQFSISVLLLLTLLNPSIHDNFMPVIWCCVSWFCPQLTPSLHPSLLRLHFLCNVIHVIYMLRLERKTVPFPLQIYSIFLLENWRTGLEVFHMQWHQLLCFRISTDVSMNLNYSVSSSCCCQHAYLNWKSEVFNFESNHIMEHTSCQKGRRKRMK